MQFVALKPNVSLIEVSRRFHRSNARILKATYSKGISGSSHPHWNILFIGESPNLNDLMPSANMDPRSVIPNAVRVS